jgi:hypothetical protein
MVEIIQTKNLAFTVREIRFLKLLAGRQVCFVLFVCFSFLAVLKLECRDYALVRHFYHMSHVSSNDRQVLKLSNLENVKNHSTESSGTPRNSVCMGVCLCLQRQS